MSNNLNLFFNRMKSHWTFSQTFLDLSRWKWRRCVAIGLLSLSVLSISANVLKSQVTLSITNATLYEAFEQLRKQYRSFKGNNKCKCPPNESKTDSIVLLLRFYQPHFKRQKFMRSIIERILLKISIFVFVIRLWITIRICIVSDE